MNTDYRGYKLDAERESRPTFRIAGHESAHVRYYVVPHVGIILTSYNTDVAVIWTDGTLEVFGWHSVTTTKHIGWFARHFGYTLQDFADAWEKAHYLYAIVRFEGQGCAKYGGYKRGTMKHISGEPEESFGTEREARKAFRDYGASYDTCVCGTEEHPYIVEYELVKGWLDDDGHVWSTRIISQKLAPSHK